MTSKQEEASRRRVAAGMGLGHRPDDRPLPGTPLTPHEIERFRLTAELLGIARRRLLTSPLEAHDMLLDGLLGRSVVTLSSTLGDLGYTEQVLAKALGVSLRTVQRQKKTPGKHLSPEQSGRVWKFAEILAKATEVFGSQREAAEWMKRPATGLEQRCPIDLLETPAGAELVENFLARLEYGVYT